MDSLELTKTRKMARRRYHQWNNIGMTIASLVITIGLFSILLAGIASFVSFMGHQQKKIGQQVTSLIVQQEISHFLTSTASWNNSKDASVNAASFACLKNRDTPCQGTRTTDQQYYRFSLFDSAASNSRPLFLGSPIGRGGFTSDGRTCVHSLQETPQTGSDACPYFVEIGWKFQCDAPCVTDSIKIKADVLYKPRTQQPAMPQSSVITAFATFREPHLLNSVTSRMSTNQSFKWVPTRYPQCPFASGRISQQIYIAEPSTLLVQAYGKSHVRVEGHIVDFLVSKKENFGHGSSLHIYLDPGCDGTGCLSPTSPPPTVSQWPVKNETNKVFISERDGVGFTKCPTGVCSASFNIDAAGVIPISQPGYHTIYVAHQTWNCAIGWISPAVYGDLDLTTLNFSLLK